MHERLAPSEARPLVIETPPLVAGKDLPALEDAAILEPLQDLSLGEFRAQFAEETPRDSRGFVDYVALLDLVMDHVGKDFKWPNVDNDVHHLQWTSEMYDPKHFNGSGIPHEFREIPFHKLYIPRQLHDFIHTITLPPEMPTLEAMHKRVKAYRRAEHLFNAAVKLMDFEVAEQVGRTLSNGLFHIPTSFEPPTDWYKWAKTSRFIERDVLLDRYIEFARKYEQQIAVISRRDLDGLFEWPELDVPTGEVISMLRSTLPIERKRRASIKPDIPLDSQPYATRGDDQVVEAA